jgi:hypothetical protein
MSKNNKKLEKYVETEEKRRKMTSESSVKSLKKSAHYATLLVSHQGGNTLLGGGEIFLRQERNQWTNIQQFLLPTTGRNSAPN